MTSTKDHSGILFKKNVIFFKLLRRKGAIPVLFPSSIQSEPVGILHVL